MSFDEFYETWWLDHQNNVLAPTPKEAMRHAWLEGRKLERAAQQTVALAAQHHAHPCNRTGDDNFCHLPDCPRYIATQVA